MEVRITDYDVSSGGDDDGVVTDWEAGLPNIDDLPPLSQLLISPELASAFNITPEPHRSMIDVTRASRETFSALAGQPKLFSLNKHDNDNNCCTNKSFSDDRTEEMVVDGDETVDLTPQGSDSRKLRRVDTGGGSGGVEEADSALRADDSSARASKRNRLVWTPQLHKRFVEVVKRLGVKNAVPKTIMQLMNVEGLTRENVASHLQKYRLYVKRMHGLSNEEPSRSDYLFASTPDPNSSQNSSHNSGNKNCYPNFPIPMPYLPQMVPLPYLPPQTVPNSGGGGGSAYHHGFEYHSHPYNMMMHPKDWSGNNFGSVSSYQQRLIDK